MDPRPKNRRASEGEIRQLTQKAAALFAAVIILLFLLFVPTAPEKMRSAVNSIAFGASAIANSPSPTKDPTVFIRLADVDEDVSPEVIIKLMRLSDEGERITLTGDGPKVLVYHTHDTEAYRQTAESTYAPCGDFRTEEADKSVMAVGEELCRILREEYGIYAIHAEERHEKPLITSAYSRSLATALYYKERYPTLEMFIDLHRDGVDKTGYENDFVIVDGLECARMMFVVGTGKSGKSSQYAPEPTGGAELLTPDFESNYALALRLTSELLSYNDRFMRNVRVKSGKYNQQISSECMLIEVGHNGNTLEQAMNSMKYLARAIASLAEDNGE